MKNIITLLLISVSFYAHTQELKVSADKNPAIVGEQIILQYSIDKKGDNFISPDFNGLRVLSGPNPSTQSSYSYVNGKSESKTSTTYSYYIKATKEGLYNISAASIKINGNIISSKPYTLKIVKANKKTQEAQKKLAENLFIKVNVSKKSIVVGEQILVTYKLFTRIDLHNTELSSLPDLNGFWSKDLETSSRFKRDVIDGIAYNVATIKKSVLTAQKSGKLVIDPMELKCSILVQSKRNNRDPFANFLGRGYNTREEIIASKPVSINVSELPKSPANFNGAVGKLDIKSEVDRNTVNANDAITYKLTITGTGNIELIEPLNINFPQDFEIYDPKISERIFEGGRKRSVKIFEYLIIPRFQGEYTIPNVTIITYNPIKKQYEHKKTSGHTITVLKNNNSEQTNINQQDVQIEKIDINYIFTQTKLKERGSSMIRKGLFLFLFFLPILFLLLFWGYQKSINKTSDIQEKRRKKANKIALRRLKTAQVCIDNNNYDLFFEEIEKALWGYFADKFKVPIAKLSKETVSKYFKSLSIKESTEERFIKLLNECEYARFAATSNKNSKMDMVLIKAKEIIVDVETELR